jgi:hypothetical protein
MGDVSEGETWRCCFWIALLVGLWASVVGFVPELVALLYPFCAFLQGIGLELDEFQSGLLLKCSEDVFSLLILYHQIPECSMDF